MSLAFFSTAGGLVIYDWPTVSPLANGLCKTLIELTVANGWPGV
jgi:hypothetical protein